MNNILSLCEMTDKGVCYYLDNSITSLSYDAIYLGSEFCWEKLNPYWDWNHLISKCHKKGYKTFFVFPILPERYDQVFRILLAMLVRSGIDGVVVNDFGVLYYISQQVSSIPIVLGRLLIKSARDYIQSKQVIKTPRFPQEIIKICHLFNCIRIDTDFGLISEKDKNDLDIEIGIHRVSYITSSMCCDYKFDEKAKFASINSNCKHNCFKEMVIVPGSPLIKLGNALLYYQSIDDGIIADKIIVDIWCNQLRTSI